MKIKRSKPLAVTALRPQSTRPDDVWRQGEPSLAETLNDPIVRLVMRRDGLCPGQVRAVVQRVRDRLAR